MDVPTSTPRIAFYCSLMAWPRPSAGGVRPWALTLMNALVAQGYAVDVLTEAPAARFVDEPLLDARVRRIVLGKDWSAKFRLALYVLRHPGVRLVAALNRYNIGATLMKMLFGRRVHVTLTQHENLTADGDWKPKNGFLRNKSRVRQLFNRADAVIAVSRGVADDLQSHWGVDRRRLHVIHNPAYDAQFAARGEHPVAHPWLTSSRTCPVVMAAGRLHPVKGFDDLIGAFALLLQRLPARLLILGEGPDRERLEECVQTRGLGSFVSFVGRVADVAPWFARADVFVLSSRREGFGNVLVEALAAGLPIVSTRCPSGPEEVLEDGRWGDLVDVGDIQAMAARLERILSAPRPDPGPLRQRASAFGTDVAIRKYLEILSPAGSEGRVPGGRPQVGRPGTPPANS